MQPTWRITVAAALLGLAAAGAVAAQDRIMEIGIDGGVQRQTYEGRSVSYTAFPVAWPTFRAPLRFGQFVTPALEIEPAFGMLLAGGSGSSFTSFVGSWSMLYHFRTDRSVPRPYVRAAGLVRVVGGGSTATQLGLQGALGLKVPNGERIGTRFEIGYGRAFENEEKGLAGIRLLDFTFGFSYFTR